MSKAPCQTGGMKNKKPVRFGPVPNEIIEKLGPVHLVRKADGRHALIGGTPGEQAKARRWCHHRAPFVTFTAPRRQSRRSVKCRLMENRPRPLIRVTGRKVKAIMESIHSGGGRDSFKCEAASRAAGAASYRLGRPACGSINLAFVRFMW